MNLNILGAGAAHAEEYKSLLQTSTYRKATKNMALAMIALEKSLAPIQAFFQAHRDDFALILTSQTGELETTLDFLKTLAEQQLARPLLFQNSLHNSTAGFTAIQAGITGPVISISPAIFSEEQALEMAQSFLSTRQCRYCIVLAVNVFPTWEEGQFLARQLVDGASCVVLTEELSSEIKSIGQIQSLKINLQAAPEQSPSIWEPTPQSQNILSALVADIQSTQKGHIKIHNPLWGNSELQWAPQR